MRLFASILLLALLALVGTHPGDAQSVKPSSPLKYSMVQPNTDRQPGHLAGVWISDGKSDVHIDNEGNGFVIGRNPTLQHLKFTDPALIFAKEGVTLQLKGPDGDAVTRPVPLKLARKLLNDMLDAAVKATAPRDAMILIPRGDPLRNFRADEILAMEAGNYRVVSAEEHKAWLKAKASGGCLCGFGDVCTCGPSCDCVPSTWDAFDAGQRAKYSR